MSARSSSPTSATLEQLCATPSPVADMSLGIFEASRRGAFSRTDATLANLLGRTPLDAAHVLALPD